MNEVKGWVNGKNKRTNENTWGYLYTWERRDHELIREYLNDAPVRFGECELKAGMNKSEMMGCGESNWKDSWIAPDEWKEFSQLKPIMRGWRQARPMNLEENGARFKRNSSSVFKIREWRRETPSRIVEALRNEKLERLNQRWKKLKDLGERHMTDDNSFLRQTWRRIWEQLWENRGVR